MSVVSWSTPAWSTGQPATSWPGFVCAGSACVDLPGDAVADAAAVVYDYDLARDNHLHHHHPDYNENEHHYLADDPDNLVPDLNHLNSHNNHGNHNYPAAVRNSLHRGHRARELCRALQLLLPLWILSPRAVHLHAVRGAGPHAADDGAEGPPTGWGGRLVFGAV